MSELRTCVKLLDGPEAGEAILGYKGEPADRIIVFRTRVLAEGTLVCKDDDGQYLPDDLLYRKVSRSELLDRPDFTGHPNIMPGCGFEFVEAPATTVDEDSGLPKRGEES
jgi:hypothetical protein